MQTALTAHDAYEELRRVCERTGRPYLAAAKLVRRIAPTPERPKPDRDPEQDAVARRARGIGDQTRDIA